MPTKPTIVNDVKTMNSVDILNATRNEAGEFYSDQIPQAVKAGSRMADGRIATMSDSVNSLRAIGNVMMNFQPLQNAFLTALVNRIGRVIITSKLYENPWSAFKKGLLEYGETVEEIFVNLAKPYTYNPEKSENEVFKRRIPDVKAAFHQMNYQKFYPTTVSHDQLRQAFLSYEGITDLISQIISQVYTGANYDEFLVMKYLIAKTALDGKITPVKIPEITADSARAITSTMVESAKNLTYMSDKYNLAKVKTYTDFTSLYTILTSKVSSIFDVEVLALSFNMSKAELLGRQIGVDGFGVMDVDRLALIFADDSMTPYVPFTASEIAQLNKIVGLMVDRDWFMIFDNFYNMTEIYNPEGLYWNYFYHVWKTFSISPFSNALLFTTETPAVTAVTITPATASVKKGSTLQLKATVVSTGFASEEVVWTTNSLLSTVSQTGLLQIAALETATTVIVTATSIFDVTKKGTSTVTATA